LGLHIPITAMSAGDWDCLDTGPGDWDWLSQSPQWVLVIGIA